VGKVTLYGNRIEIELAQSEGGEAQSPLIVPWTKPSTTRRKAMLVPEGAVDARPVKAETRTKLLRAIARARVWLDELTSGKVKDTRAIAEREGLSERLVRNAALARLPRHRHHGLICHAAAAIR